VRRTSCHCSVVPGIPGATGVGVGTGDFSRRARSESRGYAADSSPTQRGMVILKRGS
jgi:hypothetical protein